ncbi:MAG: 16S rRNA (adenine(1518)-N(6)/adenine(1519)-N(6))-dimethyltransferase RsmA [Firmicutes bacterium]|nr:16S rRNA (adenine(1518)-N(6)/adenine(1519)-N(6))-dimethyltransferase RsmA [Bacillota bacterium]
MSNKGFKTKKSLGQNFLKDEIVIEQIAQAAGCGPMDTVVEIGPGLGVLTDALSERAGKVIAVELDDRLIPILNTRFALRDNVEIVHEDILKFDWSGVSPEEGGDLHIAGNLPYYITTPILLGILEKKVPAKSITVMVQKEVADRIVAPPGGKDYGVLSISLQYYAKARKVLDVPAECFDPKPKVDSSVVVLDLKEERALAPDEEGKFFRLVKQAFMQRRKTLSNSLSGFDGKGKEEIEEILLRNGIDPKRRAETLSLEEYIQLSKEI